MSTVASSAVLGYDEEAPVHEETETATFALGCFWGPDAEFGALDGVVRTRVGYSGGSEPDPTYRNIGDHTEAFQVDYDPERVSYSELVAVAFENHSPRRRVKKTQYQNIVFFSDEEERRSVESYLDENGFDPESVGTRIENLTEFYPAEPYHQKHSLRSRDDLLRAFTEAGYDDEGLRESPAAAKLNGYASGHGLPEELKPVVREV